MMDIDELRTSLVALHRLPDTDAVYTIYYDESNNIRKLRLIEAGLNIGEPVCFVLAGVFHQGAPRSIDLARFRAAARISNATDEIKFDMLAKGDFMRCMGSQKIENFFDWMREESLLIHYQSTDVFYYSIVDIIDSIALPNDRGIIGKHMAIDLMMKNDLYRVLRADLAETTKLLHEFNYPDIGRARRVEFLEALIVMIESNRSLVPRGSGDLLIVTLEAGKKLDSLPFLEDETGGELIKHFMDFYLNRIALYNRSQHILDEETVVKQALHACGLHSLGRPVSNYKFTDSKSDPGIQVSDVVAGILGKLFNYVIRTPAGQIRADTKYANSRQARNLSALREIVDRAHSVNPAFAQAIMATEDRNRASILLD